MATTSFTSIAAAATRCARPSIRATVFHCRSAFDPFGFDHAPHLEQPVSGRAPTRPVFLPRRQPFRARGACVLDDRGSSNSSSAVDAINRAEVSFHVSAVSAESQRRRRKRAIACFMAVGIACAAGTAAARPKPWSMLLDAPAWSAREADGWPAQRGGGMSLQQAIDMAQRRYPGRVVRADTVTRNGRVVHVIRILGDDNRVRTVQIDAQAGDSR